MMAITNKLNICPDNTLRLCVDNTLKVVCTGDPEWPEEDEGGGDCIHCGPYCWSADSIVDFSWTSNITIPAGQETGANLVELQAIVDQLNSASAVDRPFNYLGDGVAVWESDDGIALRYNSLSIDCATGGWKLYLGRKNNDSSHAAITFWDPVLNDQTFVGATTYGKNGCGISLVDQTMTVRVEYYLADSTHSYFDVEVTYSLAVWVHPNYCCHIWVPPEWSEETTYAAGARVRDPANPDNFYISLGGDVGDPLPAWPYSDASWECYDLAHCRYPGTEQCAAYDSTGVCT
jgi:hypothetical protein